jgi:hypothetical protein
LGKNWPQKKKKKFKKNFFPLKAHPLKNSFLKN